MANPSICGDDSIFLPTQECDACDLLRQEIDELRADHEETKLRVEVLERTVEGLQSEIDTINEKLVNDYYTKEEVIKLLEELQEYWGEPSFVKKDLKRLPFRLGSPYFPMRQ